MGISVRNSLHSCCPVGPPYPTITKLDKLKLAQCRFLLVGRLGLGNRESHSCPQQVPMPPGQEAQRVVCGIDSSMILTVSGQALACGSNRYVN